MKTLTISKAYVTDAMSRPVLVLELATGETFDILEPKTAVLGSGVLPLPPELADYGEPLEIFTAEPDGTDVQSLVIDPATREPVALELARAFAAGEFKPETDIRIPTAEEAAAKRWRWSLERGLFRA